MKVGYSHLSILLSIAGFLNSCRAIEKASIHGFVSGNYNLQSDRKNVQMVYLDITEDEINVHPLTNARMGRSNFWTIPLMSPDSVGVNVMVFKKQSLDVDMTSIVFKHRPSVQGLPVQLTTDLNMALYVGWRHDRYRLVFVQDPLGRAYSKISGRGYDFGLFAGPGATIIGPLNTNTRVVEEFSGMIIQAGFAGFLETNMASFGMSLGYDFLVNPERTYWVYQHRPWVGFIVGIALN